LLIVGDLAAGESDVCARNGRIWGARGLRRPLQHMRVVFIEERAKRELLKEFLENDSPPFSAWTRYSLR
jgi:hypothetical protein